MSQAQAPEAKDVLLQSSPEYRDLAERHHELEDKLHIFAERHYLTTSEEFEEVSIKKRKLALKDQMETIAREYAQARGRDS